MMNFLAQILAWVNIVTNSVGEFVFAPIGVLPGWLSNTVISAVVGVILLIIFKYTSNQSAIGRVKDNIKADMLAMKLFKDSISVTLQSQVQVFKGACLLLVHAIRPMLVMMVPVVLLLAQLGLWYQYRPLLPSEEALVSMKLNGDIEAPWPSVSIEPTSGTEVTMGPVRVFSSRELLWKIKAVENGNHHIVFQVDDRQVNKELVVGAGFMRVSVERPGWRWSDILTHPAEKPFRTASPVKSISITYPDRPSLSSGTDWWMIYFFAASVVFAFIFKPFLKVKI